MDIEHLVSGPRLNILFVDDEEQILSALRRLCIDVDADCFFENSGELALRCIEQNNIDIIVSDMCMPGMGGIELLTNIAANYPEIIRIALTGDSDQSTVLDAINHGHIWGYLLKPWNNEQLITTLDQAIFLRRLILERLLLQRTVSHLSEFNRDGLLDFIGDSPAMQAVYHVIEKAGPSSASIFITGESGTGKELAAEAIHALSHRKDKPFITLNCAAIPSELLESEVFGHIKGAFSGAIANRDGAASEANGGTLFLDELGEMDIGLQAKLLRFIQSSSFARVGSSKIEKVDIRFICATNCNPAEAIQQGQLREDLFYRLNVISLKMPSLRDREWDALLLANHFLQKFAKKEDKSVLGFDEKAEQVICNYQWPGNVRQLENAINSSVVMSSSEMITVSEINQSLCLDDSELSRYCEKSLMAGALPSRPLASKPEGRAQEPTIETVRTLRQVERDAVEQALSLCDENVSKAASLLDVSPSTLYRKMQQWQLEP